MKVLDVIEVAVLRVVGLALFQEMFRTTLSDSINSEETNFVVRHIHTYRKQKKKKQSST